jgi:hypothetical protein
MQTRIRAFHSVARSRESDAPSRAELCQPQPDLHVTTSHTKIMENKTLSRMNTEYSKILDRTVRELQERLEAQKSALEKVKDYGI